MPDVLKDAEARMLAARKKLDDFVKHIDAKRAASAEYAALRNDFDDAVSQYLRLAEFQERTRD
jgi:hypothetical protein